MSIAASVRRPVGGHAPGRALFLTLLLVVPTLLAAPTFVAADPDDASWGVASEAGLTAAGQIQEVARFPAPDRVAGAAAASDGLRVFTFGGEDAAGLSDRIGILDPVGNTLDVAAARLPTPRRDVAAVTAGSAIYLFGGRDASGPLADVLRFDPATRTLAPLPGGLPTARSGVAAAWTGSVVVLAGGRDASGPLAHVLSFDPTNGTVALAPFSLPSGLSAAAATWSGSAVHVFGGLTAAGAADTILRLDPGTSTVETLAARLPSPRSGLAASWEPRDQPYHGCGGGCAFLFGGASSTGAPLAEILRFTPDSGAVAFDDRALPAGVSALAAARIGQAHYLVGGAASAGPIQQILRFTPSAPVVEDAGVSSPRSLANHAGAWADGAFLTFGGTTSVDCCWNLGGVTAIQRIDPVRKSAELLGSLPEGRFGMAAVPLGAYVYLIGGCACHTYWDEGTITDKIWRYEVGTGRFRVMNSTLPGPRTMVGAVAHEGIIYIAGGEDFNTHFGDLLRFDPAADVLTSTGIDLGARLAPALLSYGGRVHVVGGPTLLEYDPGTNTIVRTTAVPAGAPARAAAVGEYAYLFHDDHPRVYRYDPAEATVTDLGEILPFGGMRFPAVATDGVDVYLSGMRDWSFQPQYQVLRFDPRSSHLDEVFPSRLFPTARSHGAVASTPYGVFVFGGRQGDTPLDQILRFDPATGTWEILSTRLPRPLWDVHAVWTGTEVLLLGGQREVGHSDNFDFYHFDPGTRSLRTGGRLPVDMGAGVGVAWDGRYAYVMGGHHSPPTTEVVRYDPQSGTTAVVATLDETHSTYGGAGVSDGRYVYLIGGVRCHEEQTWTIGPGHVPIPIVVERCATEGLIHRFDPVTSATSTVGNLPSARAWLTGAWDGSSFLLAGGEGSCGECGNVIRVSFTAGVAVELAAATFPGRHGAMTAWNGTHLFVLGGRSGASDLDSVLRYHPVPSAPTAFSIAHPGAPGELALSWSTPDPGSRPLVGYRIERAAVGGPFEPVVALPASATSYTDGGLPASASFTYRILASNALGDGPPALAVGRTSGTPEAPTGFRAASGPGATAISLTWQPPARDGGAPVLAYRIYRGETPGTETLLAEASGDARAWRDATNPTGVTRSYRVSAVNTHGEGPATASVAAATPSPPAAPVPFAVKATARGTAVIGWCGVASGGGAGGGYHVYGGDAPEGLAFLATVPFTPVDCSRRFTDTGVADNVVRYYRLEAFTDAGASPSSPVVAARSAPGPVVTPPEDVTVAPGQWGTRLIVRWTHPVDDGGSEPTTYRVFRSANGGAEARVAEITNPLTYWLSYEDAATASGTEYAYRVQTVNAVGAGPLSEAARFRTWEAPRAPANLTAVPGVGQVSLAWEAPADTDVAPVGYYRLLSKPQGSPYWQTDVALPADARTHVDTGLQANSSYEYSIRAVNQIGYGPESLHAHATTLAEPPRSAPGFPAVTPGPGTTDLRITWRGDVDTGSPLTAYRLYRAAGDGAFAPLADVPLVTQHVDRGLTPGTTYRYRVSALNSIGEGPLGRTVEAVPGDPGRLAFDFNETDEGFTVERPPAGWGGSLGWNATRGRLEITSYRREEWDSYLVRSLGAPWTPDRASFRVEGRFDVGDWGEDEIAFPFFLSREGTANAWAAPGSIALRLQTYSPQGYNHHRIELQYRDGGGVVRQVAYTDAWYTLNSFRWLVDYNHTTRQLILEVRDLADGAYGMTAFYTVPAAQSFRFEEMGAGFDGQLEGGYAPMTLSVDDIVSTLRLAPQAPAAPAAVVPSPGEAVVSWSALPEPGTSPVTAYRLYRSAPGGAPVKIGETAGLNFSDRNLPRPATYEYRLSAVTAVGESPRSPPVTLFVAGKPGAPRNLAATRNASTGNVSLAWDPPQSDGGYPVTAYVLSRATNGGAFSPLATLGPVHAHVDTPPLLDATYQYRVAAVNADGEGPGSAAVSAARIGAPSAPRTLQVGPSGSGELRLTWQPPADLGSHPVLAYRVYRGNTSGTLAFLKEVGPVLNATDGGLPPGVTRYYRVAAVNALGESPLSPEAVGSTAAPPGPPLGPGVTTGPGRGELTFRWSPPAQTGGLPVIGYRVYRGPTSTSLPFLVEVGNVRSFLDSGLGDGKTYYYRVKAVTAAGEGSGSSTVHGVTATKPSAPQNLKAATTTEPGATDLTWSPPASTGGVAVTQYRVYRGETADDLVAIANTPATTYRDSGGVLGKTYHYAVTAVNVVGESPRSATASAPGTGVPSWDDLGAPSLEDLGVPDPSTEPLGEEHPVPAGMNFSDRYDFNWDDEGFRKEADQLFSDVGWDALWGRIAVTSDRMDGRDELFTKPLHGAWTTASGSFALAARWRATTQGNHQFAFPLFIGAAGATSVDTAPGTAYVLYQSKDSNLRENPSYHLRYRDASGVHRIAKEIPAAVNTEYRFAINYDAETRVLRMAMLTAAGGEVGSASYTVGSAPGDGFAFGKVGVASHGWSNSFEPATVGWVDDVDLSYVRA